MRELGSLDEARHLLDVGFQRDRAVLAQHAAPAVGDGHVLANGVSHGAGDAPAAGRTSGWRSSASLAYLNQFLHQFLVSTGERFRLRLYVLGRGFGLATRFLLQSTSASRRTRRSPSGSGEQIEALRGDFQTLTDESLASLRGAAHLALGREAASTCWNASSVLARAVLASRTTS